MMGKTHAWTGVAAGLGYAAVTNQVTDAPVWGYALAFSTALLPDLDQHKSLASRSLINKPAHMVLKHFRHRRFTHSLLGVAAFAIIFGLLLSLLDALLPLTIPSVVLELAVVGYTSHIAADMFNKQGVQLFYPFSPFKLEWWAIPLPRGLRISTIHDDQGGVPLSLGKLQNKLHTEKWFFTYPVYAVIAYVVWHNATELVGAAHRDGFNFANSLPGVLSKIALALLS